MNAEVCLFRSHENDLHDHNFRNDFMDNVMKNEKQAYLATAYI